MSSAPRLTAERIAALGVVRTFPADRVLIHEGESSDEIYVVLDGRLKVFLSDEHGREIILNELTAGDYFGELTLDGGPRSASVGVVDEVRLAVVQAERFKAFLAADPEAAFELLVSVIRMTRHMTRVAGNLALIGVYGRVARWLLDHATTGADGRRTVPGGSTQQEIADRIGATREMVNRVIQLMRSDGVLQGSCRNGMELLPGLEERAAPALPIRRSTAAP